MPPKKKKRATQRPPPCPAPPASLVKLLNEDASVLSYFGALQANLQADVDVWKDRAQTWELQVKTLQRKLRKQETELKEQNSSPLNSKPVATAATKRRRRRRQSSTDEDDMIDSDDSSSAERRELLGNKKDQTRQTKKASEKKVASKLPSPPTAASARRHHQLMQGSREITEEDLLELDMSSSDSDSNGNCRRAMEKANAATATTAIKKNGTSEKAFGSKSPTTDIPQPATESPASMQGEDADTQQTQGDSQSESETICNYTPDYAQQAEKVPPETKQYFLQVTDILKSLELRLVDEEKKRRSDEAVCNDIKTTLEWLCRHAYSEEEMLQAHPPFARQLPATADDHLARQAFRMVVQAFFLLDTFSEQWTKTDLEGRQDTLCVLEKRLCDEIVYEGPRRDRALRLSESTSFFSPDDEVVVEDDFTTNNSTDGAADGLGTLVSAKSLPKLLVLLERVGWAQILIGIQLSRNDISSAVRIIRDYILVTVASLGKDENVQHPRLAPVLSFVVLEAMMTTDLTRIGWDWNGGKSENVDTESLASQVWGDALTNEESSVYAMSLRHTASIWQQRAKSSRDRVGHVAQLEFAAYERLCRSCCLGVLACDSENLHRLDNATWDLVSPSKRSSYQLLLVFKGSCDVSISSLIWNHEKDRDWNLSRIVCWFVAIRHMCLRRLCDTKAAVGTPAALDNNTPTHSLVEKCRKQLAFVWERNPFQGKVDKVLVLATLLKSASLLADGDSVFFYSEQLIALLETMNPADYDNDDQASLLAPVWEILRHVTKQPLARVINLQRRPDRWEFMLGKAMEQDFLIIRGVKSLCPAHVAGTGENGNISTNNHAFDGKWPRAQLLKHVGTPMQLAKLVETEWYPVHLAPFDRDAPKHDQPTRMHASEIACALSHIASWRACGSSLQQNAYHHQSRSCGLIRQPAVLRRTFQIAGYASGAPLHWKNGAMPPTPIWLILEDDAHVENSFNDKLGTLLKELPRDFHYCALGYSRPKSAPILSPWPSRPRVGIPTHLFFATGYIVSQAGLDYLNENGPVQGPIDAWLGLLQTRNFDNPVGQRLGVGSHGKGGTLTSGTAATLMDFMAYCAVPVLCQQPLTKGNWKEKDTDIVYSGHS